MIVNAEWDSATIPDWNDRSITLGMERQMMILTQQELHSLGQHSITLKKPIYLTMKLYLIGCEAIRAKNER
ncbi:hypothetical protein CXB77_13795 [Chromatium okenii]|uniref:Uncharacterized protein n=1 Tax=Chromatium okenii TaxID=61644 RepID=A0A2S7XPK2_9GAMM|nr:hypothetical protein CXB77_13795 [Chromatium okenii]